MSLQNIPFYIYWEKYIEFIDTNFSNLVLSDDVKFLGFIILNIAMIFCIYLMFKLVKFVVILGKNLIYR